MFMSFEDETQAYYVSALLNSSPARQRVDDCITTKAHKDIISVVPIPRPTTIPTDADKLSSLAKECHAAAMAGDDTKLKTLEQNIDEIAAKLWRISAAQLKSLQKAASAL